jgi:CBS domain-containing protein
VSTVAEFLARFPPFDALSARELQLVADRVEVQRFAGGEIILVEDGTPARVLYVVAEGAVALVHQGELVEILEPGECFGHPSLLTGMAPAFTVRGHGASNSCFLIHREDALGVLGRPAGAGYVAVTLRQRMTQTGHMVHALPEMATVRVGELVNRPPLTCDAGDSIREVARIMTENHSSAILVSGRGPAEIVTDATLRARVVAGDVAADDPVARICVPAVSVASSELAVEAMIEMLAADVDHLVVLDASGATRGVLAAADLMVSEAHSPFALRHSILRAASEDALVAAAAKLPRLFLALHGTDLSPVDISRVLTLQLESLTSRLIDLAIETHGPAPVAWAWIALGSAARREVTLASDQENAIAYADDGEPSADAYFGDIARDVNRALARCGFPPDANRVLAESPLWRMSERAWIRVFEDCLESPDRSHLIRATVAFDFRQLQGGLPITPPLVAVLRHATSHADFLRQIARTATDIKPPLGFRGSLAAKTIDLKRRGVIPISNLARFFALANGITISNTLDRLTAAQELGALEGDRATELREAALVIARIRFDHHAAQIHSGIAPDNAVDPGDLPPLARAHLRDAFLAISRGQKRLAVHTPLGI